MSTIVHCLRCWAPLQPLRRSGPPHRASSDRAKVSARPSPAFTLVETIMALTIFAMLALAITSGTLLNQRMSQELIMQDVSHNVALGYLQQIRSKSLPNLIAFANGANDLRLFKVDAADGAGTSENFMVSNGVPFSEEVSIGKQRRDGSIANNTFEIVVTPTVTLPNPLSQLEVAEITVDYALTYAHRNGNKTITGVVHSAKAL